MQTFINSERPAVYCPGCSHEKLTTGLDRALVSLKLCEDKIAIVTDIGCSGLFDTRFNVHALHGVHGRALTYAAGLKLADPDLTVIVTMGDGGLGIGGAHVLAACRRNLDLTLIILNNFNFGMTGGQYSMTTPQDAVAGSGFLNKAEIPLDICAVALSAGATYIERCSGYDANLSQRIARAIEHKGFSIVETLGLCTGRYTKKNRLTPDALDQMAAAPVFGTSGWPIKAHQRPEYGAVYQSLAGTQAKVPELKTYTRKITVPNYTAQQICILGSAGMRIVTAADILCAAGLLAGMNVSMKTDYNITVLRGQSVGEVLISPENINYTGIESPTVVFALSDEGVARRKNLFKLISADTFVLKEKSVRVPDTAAPVISFDFKALKLKKQDWALASLGILAAKEKGLTHQLLMLAVKQRFDKDRLPGVLKTLDKIKGVNSS